MVKKVNREQIVSLELVLNKVHPWYVWKDKVSFMGFVLRKSGFYYTFTISDDKLTTEQEILKNTKYCINGRTVCFKPHIKFTLSNGDKLYRYFESELEASQFYESFAFVSNSVTLITD